MIDSFLGGSKKVQRSGSLTTLFSHNPLVIAATGMCLGNTKGGWTVSTFFWPVPQHSISVVFNVDLYNSESLSISQLGHTCVYSKNSCCVFNQTPSAMKKGK